MARCYKTQSIEICVYNAHFTCNLTIAVKIKQFIVILCNINIVVDTPINCSLDKNINSTSISQFSLNLYLHYLVSGWNFDTRPYDCSNGPVSISSNLILIQLPFLSFIKTAIVLLNRYYDIFCPRWWNNYFIPATMQTGNLWERRRML